MAILETKDLIIFVLLKNENRDGSRNGFRKKERKMHLIKKLSFPYIRLVELLQY